LGVQTISPSTNLPPIIYPVIIDGFTQYPCSAPGATTPCSQPNADPTCNDALLLIELEGSQLDFGEDGIGLNLVAGSSTVQGLVINRFVGGFTEGAGIRLGVNGGNTIQGNFIGTDASGTQAVDPDFNWIGNDVGVLIDDCAGNTIGGAITDSATAAARNLISANNDDGIRLTGVNASGNIIRGNFIGTDSSGTSIIDDSEDENPMGNFVGIEIYDGSNNVVGNADFSLTPRVAGAGNVISGNLDMGVEISSGTPTGPTGNGVGSNFIGTDLLGTAILGNFGDGVELCQDAHNNLIGGSSIDFRNIIANNSGNGVNLLAPTLAGNTIRLNSIHDNYTLGIDLGDDGVTQNDPGGGDDDTGPNDRQNFPVIQSASITGSTITISGNLNSTPGQTFMVDFYANASCNDDQPANSGHGEGQSYIGSLTNVSTGLNGDAPLLFTGTMPPNAGSVITATATNAGGSTSEFSQCFAIVQSTTTIITNASSLSTTPSTFNASFTVQWSVTPSSSGTPTGMVTVSVASSTESCTAPVANNQCQITPTSAGTKQLMATYSGDSNFTGSSSSPAVSHRVDHASTLTTITNDSSLSGTPSNIGQAFTVQWQVSSTPAGATGTVSVTIDGNPGCSALVSAGQCDVTPSTSGTKSLVAHYGGDGNFLSSDSSPVNHAVNSPLISGHVDYCITPSANVPGVTINVTGSQTTSTTTDSSGDYSINLPEGGNYTLTPTKTALSTTAAGIDTADVIGAQRHFLGLTSLNGCALTAADADKDSTVDTVDAIAIQRFFIGANGGTGHVGEWQFSPARRPYSNLATSQSAQGYESLVIGDITGDVTPSLANPEARNSAAPRITPSSVATVSLPVGNVGTSVTVFTLPVTTSNINASDNLVGFQGDFTFDSSVVTFQAAPASPAGLTASNWNVSGNVLGPGTIKTLRISAFSTTSTPLSGSGTLFNLNFTRVSNTEGASTPLTWASSPNNFVFIDTNLVKQTPGSTPPGSITIVGPTAANGNVSGQIVDNLGNPVEGVAVRMSGTQNRLTVTDANGRYNFDEVETNGFYTVTPSRSNFVFSPAQRSFSALGQHTDAAFNGSATGNALNPLDATEYFVRQQYVDFLNREPDEAGSFLPFN
jgi:hypothetical protein